MKKSVWSENYRIASYLVNLRKKAGLLTILGFIEDVGWQHAIHLEVKLQKNHGWIFTRQKLVMTDWPSWNETVTVKTWLRPVGAEAYILRDYEIYANDRKVGECTSTFMVMNLETRKLANQDWSEFSSIWQNENVLTHKPDKIPVQSDVQNLAEFQVRNSDIDLNQHVNNTRYAQWILDSLPIDILKSGVNLQSYEVNFLAETKSGDVITIQRAKQDRQIGESSLGHFQGFRAADSKVVFTAALQFTKNL